MRTTVTIPDNLVQSLMKLTHALTRTEAVNKAVTDWIRTTKRQELRSLRGKIQWEGDLDAMRAMEIAEKKADYGRRPR